VPTWNFPIFRDFRHRGAQDLLNPQPAAAQLLRSTLGLQQSAIRQHGRIIENPALRLNEGD
jgi:hypothetical protein